MEYKMTAIIKTAQNVELLKPELESELITKDESLELLKAENTTLTLKVKTLESDIIMFIKCLEDKKKINEALKKANDKALKDIEGLQSDIKALKKEIQRNKENTRNSMIKLKNDAFKMLENAIQREFLTEQERIFLKELADINNPA